MTELELEQRDTELKIMRCAISRELNRCKPILKEILNHQRVMEDVNNRFNDETYPSSIFIAPYSF